ncbi:MAG: type II toxin-antitoxin system HicB family antitoxin [bacterium]
MIPIEFDAVVFREGELYIGYAPELDVSSCGETLAESHDNLKMAVRLFLEEAEKMGTLEEILAESGFHKGSEGKWNGPRMVSVDTLEMT